MAAADFYFCSAIMFHLYILLYPVVRPFLPHINCSKFYDSLFFLAHIISNVLLREYKLLPISIHSGRQEPNVPTSMLQAKCF